LSLRPKSKISKKILEEYRPEYERYKKMKEVLCVVLSKIALNPVNLFYGKRVECKTVNGTIVRGRVSFIGEYELVLMDCEIQQGSVVVKASVSAIPKQNIEFYRTVDYEEGGD